MKQRTFKVVLSGVAALGWLALARPALADDSGRTDDAAEHDSDGGKSGTAPDHADPSTKTLPQAASATAKANAFGQQGARQKAAHAAAKSAAVQAARHAGDGASPTLPPQAVDGRAHAQDAGKPSSPGSQGQRGLDVAAAHGANGSPTAPHGHH